MPARKIVIGFWLLVISILLPAPVFAQPAAPAPAAPATAPWNAQNQSNFTSETLQHAILCNLAGISPVGSCVAFAKDSKTGKIKVGLYERLPNGGALGGISSAVTALYTPPTSTVQYLAHAAGGFGIIDPAYAAVVGSGAGIISPVEKLWGAMSNIAYVVFILIFLAVGFMIMFRQKLNAQTVLTVQSALPGLVVGLVLVYFSYFIAAVIIDISFLGIQLVAQIFDPVKLGARNSFGQSADDLLRVANQSNIFNIFTSSFQFWNVFDAVRNGVSQSLGYTAGGGDLLGRVFSGAVGAIAAGLILGPAGLLMGTGAAVGAVIPEIIGMLVPVVLLIALFIQFFKLLFKLIQSYIMLLITTILGPFFIMIGSVPGKGGALAFWWKNLLGHSLVFPAVFAVFLFAGMVLASEPSGWQASPPLLAGLPTGLLRIIVAYGIILGTPAVPNIIKKAIGAQDFGEIGQTGAAGFLAGFGTAKGGGKAGFNRLFAPERALRNEYRTLQEQEAMGRLGDEGKARLADIRSTLAKPSFARRVQRFVVETANKPFSGKS